MRQVDRVLVTGGRGFLGGHLSARLSGAGVQVVTIDDGSTSPAPNRPDGRAGGRHIHHDISMPVPDEVLGGRFDVVFHLASPASPADYQRLPLHTMRAGALGTANALEIAERHAARFVLASTSEVYGDPLEYPQRETYWGNVNPIGPQSVYDEAKRFAEALTFAHRRAHETDIGVARIFNTYGPGMRPDDGRVVPTFCCQALCGEPLTVAGTGLQTRSLCYVDDTVAGLIALARTDFSGPVNIGSPIELTVLGIAELIRDLAGSRSPIQHIGAAPDDPRRRCPDISLARNWLGWQPTVSHIDGLAATVEWFRTHLVPGGEHAHSGH